VDEDNRLIGSVRMNAVVEYLFPFTAVLDRGNEMMVGGYVDTTPKTVSKIMNPEPVAVAETTPLSDVARILMEEKINELPVIDAERHVIGQVNVYEFIMFYLNELHDNA